MPTRELQFPRVRISKPRRAEGPQRSTETAPHFDRGVFRLPYLVGDQGALCAISSDGRRLAEVPLRSEEDEAEVTTHLERLLDFIDPPTARAELGILR